MEDIELSVMSHGAQEDEAFVQLLQEFQAKSHIRTHVQFLPWNTAASHLIKVALYHNGPDVSEVGNTWVSDYVAMNALYAFSLGEIDSLGGKAAFWPVVWNRGQGGISSTSWVSVPWYADTRLIYYRKDLLEQAGIDEATAFHSPQALLNTLACLQKHGDALPWVIPSAHSRMLLHHLASWVWGAGGDFLDDSGKQVRFNETQAFEGIIHYFETGRFLSPPARNLDEGEADLLFLSGQVAATLSGMWLYNMALNYPVGRDRLGVCLPPGVPFVGGSDLVMWRHTQRPHVAMELIRFLTSHRVQSSYLELIGQLPVRMDAVNTERQANDPVYQTMLAALHTGRSFPSISMLGLVEGRLVDAGPHIWSEIFSTPDADIPTIVHHTLDRVAKRLNITLAS
jgi:multiple sugar transport system substrate-binding protein